MIFFPPQSKAKNPAILFIHGWGSDGKNNIARAEEIAKQGYICVAFNLPGHGDQPGDRETLSFSEFLDACTIAYDKLADLPEVDVEKISLVTASFGSYLGLLLSQKRKVYSIILRAPADYPNVDFTHTPVSSVVGSKPVTQEWRSSPHKLDESYSLEAISDFGGDIFIIESSHDDAVPHQTILNYSSAVKNKNHLTYAMMQNQNHSLDEKGQREFTKMVIDFLIKQK